MCYFFCSFHIFPLLWSITKQIYGNMESQSRKSTVPKPPLWSPKLICVVSEDYCINWPGNVGNNTVADLAHKEMENKTNRVVRHENKEYSTITKNRIMIMVWFWHGWVCIQSSSWIVTIESHNDRQNIERNEINHHVMNIDQYLPWPSSWPSILASYDTWLRNGRKATGQLLCNVMERRTWLL